MTGFVSDLKDTHNHRVMGCVDRKCLTEMPSTSHDGDTLTKLGLVNLMSDLLPLSVELLCVSELNWNNCLLEHFYAFRCYTYCY